MCEKTEDTYLDGEVVWVKLGSCWWPGEVVGPEKLPPDVLPSFRKPPIAVVKFFQEDTYEYVKNSNAIFKYNCSRKNEFINKGLYMYRTKHGHMEKFPEDVIRAETAVGGDIEILTRDEFQEQKKESYAGIFGDAKKTPVSAKGRRGRPSESSKNSTPFRRGKEKADYKVHILVQGSKTESSSEITPGTPDADVPSTSGEQEATENQEDSQEKEQIEKIETNDKPVTPMSTPTASSSGIYSCHACSFTTTRLNVLILHNKTHSVSFMPYTPSTVRKKPSPSQTTPVRRKVDKEHKPRSALPKTPKVKGRPHKEKTEEPKKSSQSSKKRIAEEDSNNVESKKAKTDEEIKSSLLADWDDGDDESNDESSTIVMAGSPEVPEAAKSPAVPTSAELASASNVLSSPSEKKSNNSTSGEKPESSSDSKYEFCEDEDWPVEADAGRKIPRVKNPKRKEESKSLSLDEDDVAREVAELLNKTTVPELPSAPEPLKVEENFPEPSIVKSPDKKDKSPDKSEKPPDMPATKAIFKTKTFFRSRHSRSQDAIGKYVAEQLNAVERMDIAESELNGSEVVSSPEARESPPIEQVKVARLAPKIQLKKMKAEAAQLRDKDKNHFEQLGDVVDSNTSNLQIDSPNTTTHQENKPLHDVLYPTQEIKPVNTDVSDQVKAIYNVTVPVDTTSTQEENIVVNENINILPESEIDNNIDDNTEPIIKFPETSIQKSYEQSMGHNMNESTASAVDALLSVSREADRVTRVISDDPPEDLFEDDNKDNSGSNNDINGFSETINTETDLETEQEPVTEKCMDNNNKPKSSEHELINDDVKTTEVHQTENPNEEAENNLEQNDNITEETNNINMETIEISTQPTEIPTESTEEVMTHSKIPDEDNEIPMETNEIHNQTPVESNELPYESYEDEIKDQSQISENFVENTPSESENVPSESDLQIAETLINLPSTAIQNKTNDFQMEHYNLSLSNENSQETATTSSDSMVLDTMDEKSQEQIQEEESVVTHPKSLLISNNENMNVRFETEQEKSENLNAAQSLVQMSESIDHKMNIDHNLPSGAVNDSKEVDKAFKIQNNGLDNIVTVEQKLAMMSNENCSESATSKSVKIDSTSSNLLKILEEPSIPRIATNKVTPTKQIITPKEKILNFDVAKTFKGKSESPKQKIIIRRTTSNKSIINNMNDISPEKIILSRSNNPAQDGSVQTYTIQTSPEAPPSDANTIIIQQKIRKISKAPVTKLQKIKPHNSLITPKSETTKIINEAATDDAMFDINSMPIVLSEDLQLTPENIEKMPIVMSDGNIIQHTPNPPKLIKPKQPTESEKVIISASSSKPEVKTLLMNPVTEVSKVTTPNILSKSSKLRGGKPMLIIDKTTGKQKIVMTKPEPAVKEVKQPPTLIQAVPQNTGKGEKFIILPTANSPRPGRTQKIVIDPQTGKAHVLVAKGSDTQIGTNENKPVSAKLVPPSDASTPGNTVMIITNAQGAQSRIVLTPEHEKMLFPKKQQPNISQLKTITHRISTNPAVAPKTLVTTIPPTKTQNIGPVKTQTRIVPKQKSAIITSKGQLIVGGRVATTAQNIAPMPEVRPVPKRIIASEPKKLVQTIQKNSSEPLIFLQQKSGAVMQLTAAQFEHLQRTGQIVQKPAVPVPEKVVVQKTITITPNEAPAPVMNKSRLRKIISESPMPSKKLKQEIAIAPAPSSIMPPALTPLSNHTQSIAPAVTSTVPAATSNTYPEFENFEELLPSTAIVKQQEPIAPAPAPAPAPAAPLSDGQLLAVPGEHFGGPQGSFYLCVEDNGTLTPIDNRPLVLENNQLVPMAVEPLPVLSTQPERRDILEAALANSDVFHADTARDEAPDFRDLNANVSVHCRVSETSTTLNQPIMTPVEMPSKCDSEPTVTSSLEDGLAVIGVTPASVPTSLELPITVTDPRIAPAKTTDPLSNNNYGGGVLLAAPGELGFGAEEAELPLGPMSMPLLTDDEAVGKSMPILTDEAAASSAESAGSPDVRRLLTPCSDSSEASAEIPLQPHIQLSVDELARHS